MSGRVVSYANPVRTPVRCLKPGRVVSVRFTDFARIGAQGGLLTMFGPSVDEAVRDLVRRLEAPAEELQARAQQLGDVAILRRMPAHVPAEFGPGTIQPVAFVEGLARDDIAEALNWLARQIATAA